MALTGRLTLEEFLLLPEAEPAYEYVRGTVTQKVSPKARHGKLQGTLYLLFETHGHPHRLLSAFTETRVVWPDELLTYVPDVIAYRVERVPLDPDGEIAEDFVVPPDIAVEIASPGQALDELMDRCRWCSAHGVGVALFVNPRWREVWTFRADSESGPLVDEDIVELGDVSPGLSFVVRDLFLALRGGPA